MSALRPEHLIDAYAKWSDKGVSGRPLSGRTVHHLHDLIRCALNFGVRREWVARNVAACLETEDLPKATKPEPIALDEAEMATLLSAARNPSERAKRSAARARSRGSIRPSRLRSTPERGEERSWVCAGPTLTSNPTPSRIRRSLTRTHSRGLFFKEPKNGKARTITMPCDAGRNLEATPSDARQRAEHPRGRIQGRRSRLCPARRLARQPSVLREPGDRVGGSGEGHADHGSLPARHARIALGEKGRAARSGEQTARPRGYPHYGRALLTRLQRKRRCRGAGARYRPSLAPRLRHLAAG